jgi:WD40 repeat protein
MDAAPAFDHRRQGLAVTDDGRALLVGTEDGQIVIDRPGAPRVALPAHLGEVTAVAVTRDDRRALTGGQDGALHLWDIDAATRIATFDADPMTAPPHPMLIRGIPFPRGVAAAAPTDDGRFAVMVTEGQGPRGGTEDSSLGIWDLDAGRLVHKLPWEHLGSGLASTRCAVSPDASVIVVSGGATPRLVRWVRWDGG